jgi:hypothetical protein
MIRYLLVVFLFFLQPPVVSAKPLTCAELVDGLEGRTTALTTDYAAILLGVLRTHPGLCPAVTTLPVAQATFLDWADSNPELMTMDALDCAAKAFSQNYSVCHSSHNR